jgi:hypothetical protein
MYINPDDIRRPYGDKYEEYRNYYIKHPILAKILCFWNGHEWRPDRFCIKCIRCGKKKDTEKIKAIIY